MKFSASLAQESLVYRYERSFNGFAAKLTKEEAARVSRKIKLYIYITVYIKKRKPMKNMLVQEWEE